MTRSIFIFLAVTLVLAPIVLGLGISSPSLQMFLCIPVILLLGIPHGAVDNLIFLKEQKLTNREFITIYIGVILINVVLWMVAPLFAYSLFLLISAYHFGQSQFAHYLSSEHQLDRLLHFSWGITLISGFIFLNLEEINTVAGLNDDFKALSPIHQSNLILPIFMTSSVSTLVLMITSVFLKRFRFSEGLLEFLILLLVLVVFYLFPFLIGFTIYFITLHALKVLREEYYYLKGEKRIGSFRGFLNLVMPFTLVSIAGLIALLGLIRFDWIGLSYGYGILIMISSITLPHVFVMEQFYLRYFKGLRRLGQP